MHQGISIREANGEVIIFLDRHAPTALAALRDADKILRRAIMKEEAITNTRREFDEENTDK